LHSNWATSWSIGQSKLAYRAAHNLFLPSTVSSGAQCRAHTDSYRHFIEQSVNNTIYLDLIHSLRTRGAIPALRHAPAVLIVLNEYKKKHFIAWAGLACSCVAQWLPCSCHLKHSSAVVLLYDFSPLSYVPIQNVA